MKQVFLVLMLFSSFALEAGGYYGSSEINSYDSSSGFYYKSIIGGVKNKGLLSSTRKSNNASNLAIYDTKTDTHKLLFTKDKHRQIAFVYFESAHQDQSIYFNGEKANYSPAIKNNNAVSERKIKDNLLIGIRDLDKEQTVLWVAKKDGSDLKQLTSVPNHNSWHLDVKNSVIRVVAIVDEDISIKNFPW